MPRGTLIAALAGTVLLAGGCSADPAPEPGPSTAESSVAPSPTPTPTPTVADCLAGRYQFVRLARTSGDGSGEGGDLTATFDQGGFVLTGVGQDPVRVTYGGREVDLSVTGSFSGTYTGAGGTGSYAVTGSEGSAKVSAGLLRRTLPMSQVVQLLAPDGTGTLSCTATDLTMTSSASRVELRRV